MRVLALSDVHVDFEENARWIAALSAGEYLDDVLILAGDVSDSPSRVEWCLDTLSRRFMRVVFVPGNHDLWVARGQRHETSLQRFERLRQIALDCDVSMQVYDCNQVSIVPLFGWYDFSFGQPTQELRDVWMDFYACRWPESFGAAEIAEHFLAMNEACLSTVNAVVISVSHFLPRIDVMPDRGVRGSRGLYPVLGSTRLETQIRKLKPLLHVYGHSHWNNRVRLEGITYVNNAMGYPHEMLGAARSLACIHET